MRYRILREAPPTILVEQLSKVPGKHALEAMFFQLQQAEFKRSAQLHPETAQVLVGEIKEMTMLPLPTEGDWTRLTAEDHDLQLIINALTSKSAIPPGAFEDEKYRAAWDRNQLATEDGLVYFYEVPKSTGARQLKLRVAPKKLRFVIMSACHASPFSGHSGIARTYARVATRYWWPSIKRDVDVLVRACLHCRVSKNLSHEAQEVLQELGSDGPFDVIFMDFWDPGDIPDHQFGDQKFLTMMCELTGHVDGEFLGRKVTTQQMLQAVFKFFCRYGMPKIVYVDAEGKFAGFFKAVLSRLLIPVVAVSRENHKAVRNERFHRFLNHVERINTIDTGNLETWGQGVHFAMYSWNAGIVDGTDVQRSVASIGREFPFPIDLKPRADVGNATLEGQQTLDYLDSTCPLLARQRALFEISVMERRKRMRELRNEGKTARSFAIGSLVVVRKIVQSSRKRGISAKLVPKVKGPYRVVGVANEGSSYLLQKLPFCQGIGVPGKIVKEKSSRMEKLPSIVVFAKMADGADARRATLSRPLAAEPLQKWLRVRQYGTYQKADEDNNWAYERVADLWPGEEIDIDSSDDDDDGDGGGGGGGPQGEQGQDNPDDTQVGQDQEDQNHDDTTDMPDAIPWHLDADEEEAAQDEAQMAKRYPPRRDIKSRERNALKKLRRAIDESQDKLFFVRFQPQGAETPSYRLVSVNLRSTDAIAARDYGVYRCTFYAKHSSDAKSKPLRDCRFWPDVRKLGAVTRVLEGNPITVRPGKVTEYVQNNDAKIVEGDVHLSADRLVGPFEFELRRKPGRRQGRASKEGNYIQEEIWNKLEAALKKHRISSDADTVGF
ncbi:MAG: integrase zinc binding domain-containing protein [Ilumatobacteraceae bacterium]